MVKIAEQQQPKSWFSQQFDHYNGVGVAVCSRENAFDEAIREKIWLNSKAQEEIVKTHIVKANKVPPKDGREIAFGDAGDGRSYGPQAMLSFHNGNNVQYKKVAQGFLAPLDDLAAALANFHFHFVVRGKVKYIGESFTGKPKYRATIDKVGVYIRDSYDFNNPQFLGVWKCLTDDVSKTGIGYVITNDDFRYWRDHYGRGVGGDYLVFSDIRIINTSDSFEFTL